MDGNGGSGYYAYHLQHVELFYVPTDTCNANGNLGSLVDDTMMCVYDVDKSGCFGDSGESKILLCNKDDISY